MDRDVSVSFLESVIFFHIMEIIPSDDDRAVHLSRNDHPSEQNLNQKLIKRQNT